jgi:UDP-N-acetylmuramoyl-L-alanyl-D-glutamate--2,6-diaminopimelate ligase
MLLSRLINEAGWSMKPPIEGEVLDVTIDSRSVQPGSVFVAIRGVQVDGHKFIKSAILSGALAIISEYLPDDADHHRIILVEDSAEAAGKLAAVFFGNPSTRMKVVGVTGTNGKTTIATLMHHLVRRMGIKAGLLSTVENSIVDTVVPSTHTTPDPIHLQQLLRQMLDAGCEYVFMEVSSHALSQKRVAGIDFAGAIFSNLTHDHLDYHGTFSEYLKAKKSFFDGLKKDAFALTNIDDKNGLVMLQNCKAHQYHYALKQSANYKGKVIENTIEGLLMEINGVEVHLRLSGEYNAYNVLAVYGAMDRLGFDKDEIRVQLSALAPPRGRLETIRDEINSVTYIIDYAHTPDALKNVLSTLRKVLYPGKRLITVVGCGGDRDHGKRPEMAHITSMLSDESIFTSDNPRNENPDAIISDMMTGVHEDRRAHVLSITDRKAAIEVASRLAQSGDIVLIAGKGHETYQEFEDKKKIDFSDRKVVEEILSIQSRSKDPGDR